MAPGLLGLRRGRPAPAGDVSVMPQPPPIHRPVSRSNRSVTSTGSVAPPDAQARSEVRSRRSMSGTLASAIHMVGTPGKTVARLTSMSCSVASASNRVRSMSRLPPARWRSITLHRP